MKIEVVGSGSILHGIDGSKVLEIPPGIYDTNAPDSVLTRELADYLIKTTNGHAREYNPAPVGQISVTQVEGRKTLGQQLQKAPKNTQKAKRDRLSARGGSSKWGKDVLKARADDVARDTRRTALAATTFTRIVAKAGKGTAEVFKDILVAVISETAKKLIWPR